MAKLTRTQKLDRKGILHWEQDGVLAFLSAKQSKDINLHGKIKPLVGAGAVLLSHIRDRMKRGQFAEGTTPKGYSTFHRLHVSHEYAEAVGLEKQHWSSVASFQLANHTKGGGWVSGGAWRGAQARGNGRATVILEASGTSEGRGKKVEIVAADGKGRTRKRRFYLSEKVSNRFKARGVWRHGVHMFEPRATELEAISADVTMQVQAAIIDGFGDKQQPRWVPGGDAGLRAKLVSGWR